ncbi:hypothetical protein BV898_19075 [Hypsibius exemplaris]|uniref:SAP domain-containing protein n=1 Tax=Hypsibius exemplaris TaxID=2072580 RepID=A0A9X6NL05_HYPEX|nr:hypothetical protein BV898_19075 [Hypsibius exemplaris]
MPISHTKEKKKAQADQNFGELRPIFDVSLVSYIPSVWIHTDDGPDWRLRLSNPGEPQTIHNMPNDHVAAVNTENASASSTDNTASHERPSSSTYEISPAGKIMKINGSALLARNVPPCILMQNIPGQRATLVKHWNNLLVKDLQRELGKLGIAQNGTKKTLLLRLVNAVVIINGNEDHLRERRESTAKGRVVIRIMNDINKIQHIPPANEGGFHQMTCLLNEGSCQKRGHHLVMKTDKYVRLKMKRHILEFHQNEIDEEGELRLDSLEWKQQQTHEDLQDTKSRLNDLAKQQKKDNDEVRAAIDDLEDLLGPTEDPTVPLPDRIRQQRILAHSVYFGGMGSDKATLDAHYKTL